MCGSHQLSRPPGHKQPSSGQTVSSVCRAWGHVTVTWSKEQWMGTTQDEREWRRDKQFSQSSIHYFSHCVKFLKTRPSPCSLCLSLIDTDCALLVSRPGAVPSGTNILWPYGPSGDQSHRNTENKKHNFIHTHSSQPWISGPWRRQYFLIRNVSTNLRSPISDSRTVRLTLVASPPPVSL